MLVRGIILMLGLALAGLALLVDLGGPGFGRGQALLLAAGTGLALCCLLPVEWIRRLLLVIAASGGGLLLTEAVLRLLAPLPTVFQIDSQYLHKYIPEATTWFRHAPVNGGLGIRVEINSQGFRGEELRPREEVRRIVVYGDSCIAAHFSELPLTFVERLEARLTSQLTYETEVINAGVVAYGPDQVSVRIEEELSELRPDLVIVSVFGENDLGDLVRNKLFNLDPVGELYSNSFIIDDSLRSTFDLARRGSLIYKTMLKIWRRVNYQTEIPEDERALANYQAERMAGFLRDRRREYREYVLEGNNLVTDLLGDYYDADVSLTPGSESAAYKVLLMERVLLRIRRTVDRYGVPFVLLIIPAAVDACERRHLDRIDVNRYPEYRRSAITDVFEDIAGRQSIHYINLFEPFRKHGADQYYFRGGDGHWNDAGQDLAAELMSRYIVSRKLLE